MRLFIGVWLGVELREEVQRYIQQAQTNCPGWKWTQPRNLHFTLKFLGEFPEDNIERLSEVLRLIAHENIPFTLQLGSPGIFPMRGIPRVMWLGVNQGQARLISLAASIESACEKIGLPHSDNPFKPHLTIARANQSRPGVDFPPEIHEFKQIVSGFSLIQSILRPEGAVYESKEDFCFIKSNDG